VLTDIDFWHRRGGDRSRIGTLVSALSRHVDLTLLWPTTFDDTARQALAMHWPGVRTHALNLPQQGSAAMARQAVRQFFVAHPQDVCIFEFLAMGWLRSAVPPGVLTFIDTHDVVSQRDADLSALQPSSNRMAMTAEREAAQLRAFDGVMAICAPDAAVFAGWVGADRVRVVPHIQVLRPRSLRPSANRLLFVGGFYGPNLAGLSWLLHEVWPRLAGLGLCLDVVGDVGPALGYVGGPDGCAAQVPANGASGAAGTGRPNIPGVTFHGLVPDLGAVYDAADLVLNPVKHGSGLKIKSVEALSRGLPLVSTAHGVRGLLDAESATDPAFCVADTAEGFAAAVAALAADPVRRERMGQAALRLARQRFSEEACLAPLLAAIGASAARLPPDRLGT
jgi:hypothetical protein